MDKYKTRITKINVGKKGLTSAVIREIKKRLPLYHIVKVKILKNCPQKIEEIEKTLLNNNFKIKRRIGKVFEILGERK